MNCFIKTILTVKNEYLFYSFNPNLVCYITCVLSVFKEVDICYNLAAF